MNFSKNYNLPVLHVGAVEWPAVINSIRDKIEAGRTIKIIAGETLAAGDTVQAPDSTGKTYKANNTHNFLGIIKNNIAMGAEGFVFSGLGNEITVGSAWTVGGLIYVGITAGTLTQSPPVDTIAIGFANTLTSIVLLRPEQTEKLTDVEKTKIGHITVTGAVDIDSVKKANLNAIVAPSATDDSNTGYAVGSQWIDIAANIEYTCVNATAGTAIWKENGREGLTGTYNLSGTVAGEVSQMVFDRGLLVSVTLIP